MLKICAVLLVLFGLTFAIDPSLTSIDSCKDGYPSYCSGMKKYCTQEKYQHSLKLNCPETCDSCLYLCLFYMNCTERLQKFCASPSRVLDSKCCMPCRQQVLMTSMSETVNELKELELELKRGQDMLKGGQLEIIRQISGAQNDGEDDEDPTFTVKRTYGKGNFVQAQLMCSQMGGNLVQRTLSPQTTTTKQAAYKQQILTIAGDSPMWIGASNENSDVWKFWSISGGEMKFPISNPTNLIADWVRTPTSAPNSCATIFKNYSNQLKLGTYVCKTNLKTEKYGLCELPA